MSIPLCVIGSSLSLALLFAGGASTAAPIPERPFRQWRTYGGDPTGAKYSSLTQINRTNVQRLSLEGEKRTGLRPVGYGGQAAPSNEQ